MVDEKPERPSFPQNADQSTDELQRTLPRLVSFLHAKILTGELTPRLAQQVSTIYLDILDQAGLNDRNVRPDSHMVRIVLKHANHAACSRLIDLLPNCCAEIEQELHFRSPRTR
jgi:hypothetical protein